MYSNTIKPFLLYKGQKLSISLPKNWHLLTIADTDEDKPGKDAYRLTQEALQKPIGVQSLSESLSASDKVTILIEDNTRISPKNIILQALLEKLQSIGISQTRILIIIALGTHRKMSMQETKQIYSENIYQNYQIINHDCYDNNLIPAAVLSSGQKVCINQEAYHADACIGIGSLNPHPMNGFGGGEKIMFPGVADFKSILEHHLRLTFEQGSSWGNIENNPFYAEVQSTAEKAGLNFIINAVLDKLDQTADIVSGDLRKAHLAGIERSKSIISQDFSSKSDITITTSYPYTHGPQIVKPLIPASLVTKKDGCIILLAECREELPQDFVQCFYEFRQRHGNDLKGSVLRCFADGEVIMPQGAIDFNMALGLTLSLLATFIIILVSQIIPAAQAEQMGFIPASNLHEAFDKTSEIYKNPTVNIIPCGGSILPQVNHG